MRPVAWAALLITVSSWFRKLPKIRRRDVEEVLLSLELFASDKAEMPFLSEGAEELRLPFVTDGAEALSPFVTDLLPELSLRWRTLRPRLRARPRLGRR